MYVLAIALGVILMLPFYWAAIGSLKQMHEVRIMPPCGGRPPHSGSTTWTYGTCASSRAG
jgi:ABC-type glycerol-3-phosphate transport system permease component